MSTISTTITNGITLGTVTSAGTYASPLTITTSGAVEASSGDAISGPLGNAWTVVNQGMVTASGIGVNLASGYVGNTGTGLIQGYLGVYIYAGAGTVTNSGTIVGTGANGVGVDIQNGAGTVTNSGTIMAIGTDGGGVFLGSGGTVVNSGTILSPGTQWAVQIAGGGYLTNSQSGYIGSGGVALDGGTVVNDGRIVDVYLGGTRSAAGVHIYGGAGTVTNSGTILATGGAGVDLLVDGSTLVNAGTISGGNGTAVYFAHGGNLVVVDPGAVFQGVVNGGTGNDTLELGSAAGIGTLSGLGTQYLGFSTVTVDAGANWTLSGSNTIDAGVTLTVLGTLTDAGTLADAGALNVVNGGTATGATILSGGSEVVSSGGTASATTILAGGSETVRGTDISATISGGTETVFSGGTASSSIVGSGGALDVLAGGTASAPVISGGSVDLASGSVIGGGVTFVGSGGTLEFATSGMTGAGSATITGLGVGSSGSALTNNNEVDLRFVSSSLITSATITGSTVTVFENSTSQTLTLDAAPVSGTFVDWVPDGNNGTDVFLANVPCFLAGTHILTPEGEVAVEDLSIGDRVTTISGEVKPVRWVGRQTVSRRFADPLRVLPIRISADALDENVPSRDLLISPDHAVLVDDILVHAGALVNGASIRRESNVPMTFTYYHVELAEHDLVLVENMPAETFIDNVDRMGFDNWAEHLALCGDEGLIAEMALPRAKAHRQVPLATRARLAARAALLCGAADAA